MVDRKTGEPMEGIKVMAYTQSYDYNSRKNNWNVFGQVITQKDGAFSFAPSKESVTIRLEKGEDVLDLRESHHAYYNDYNQDRKEVSIFTDRAIYRPGQTIYFKGLLTNVNSKVRIPSISKTEEIEFILRDVNWQIVHKEVKETNEFGTCHGAIQLPTDRLNGLFTLEAKVANGGGQTQVQVEAYKRPKIYAEFNPIKNELCARRYYKRSRKTIFICRITYE